MKIRIIGCSGSGKTFLAKKICKKLKIERVDLDDVFWDNDSVFYGTKRDETEKINLLNEIVGKNSWVIEGVYYKWCLNTFDNSDIILLLEPKLWLCRLRIKIRFLKRKFKLEKSKKETLKSVKELLDYTKRFYAEKLIKIKEILSGYENKVVVLKTKSQIKSFLNNLKSEYVKNTCFLY